MLHLILFLGLTIGMLGSAPTFLEAQDQIPNNIQISGESKVFVQNNISIIEFEIEASDASASAAENQIKNKIEKMTKPKKGFLQIIKYRYEGATSDPTKLVKGSPLKVVAKSRIVANRNEAGSLIDQLLKQTDIKNLSVSSRSSNNASALRAGYAKALQNAKIKGEFVAKANNFTLGKVLEINFVEELPPTSLRAQLESNPSAIDEDITEVRIFANVRYAIDESHPPRKENKKELIK